MIVLEERNQISLDELLPAVILNRVFIVWKDLEGVFPVFIRSNKSGQITPDKILLVCCGILKLESEVFSLNVHYLRQHVM
ncbi:hypothetical protein BST96_17395 [Oceanicoccus sagamiensis]|uniref:Uncharacterized protein n=1 Tax=Oceanicoccus sagamiensis TaxID=716816 RepID=A0A1X9NIQ7_9GAMM|nr:hypothetical protein BST96_17395 [Oceanicoccus sagamiensis]